MISTSIKAVSYVVPSTKLTNLNLQKQHPDWPIEQIKARTGISNRYVSENDEYSLELAVLAAQKLFLEHAISAQSIDFIIFCTQTPKYLLPSSACILQNILSIPTYAGAIDINQGCSGYVYSLLLADSLIKSRTAKKILLINADTYTKLIDNNDRSLKPLFGDGASASLLEVNDKNVNVGIQYCIFGTDGSGMKSIIAEKSGMLGLMDKRPYLPDLTMNGVRVFNFALRTVPKLVEMLLEKAGLSLNDIDLFIFHQANGYILEHLRDKIGIDESRFYININHYANTGSSSIALALSNAIKDGLVKNGSKVMLVAFGVGLSWAGVIVTF